MLGFVLDFLDTCGENSLYLLEGAHQAILVLVWGEAVGSRNNVVESSVQGDNGAPVIVLFPCLLHIQQGFWIVLLLEEDTSEVVEPLPVFGVLLDGPDGQSLCLL